MISAEEARAKAKRANPVRDARRRALISLQRRIITAANCGHFSIELLLEEEGLANYLESLGYRIFMSTSHMVMAPGGFERAFSLCWGENPDTSQAKWTDE